MYVKKKFKKREFMHMGYFHVNTHKEFPFLPAYIVTLKSYGEEISHLCSIKQNYYVFQPKH